MFDLGDDILNDGIARLKMIHKDLHQNNELMNAANQQIGEDNERLMEIGEKIKTTRGVLKEAGKHITAIAKSYYKDKCIVGMSIIVMLLVIVVVIVGAVKGGSSSGSTTNPATNTTNTTNSTNTTTTKTNVTALMFNSGVEWDQMAGYGWSLANNLIYLPPV